MAINPVPAFSTALPPAERSGDAAATGAGTASGFEGVLGSLRSGDPAVPARATEAAAELLRIAMMQQSLSLGGEEGAPPSTASRALESFISLLPEGARSALGGKAQAQALAAVTGEEAAVANDSAADAGGKVDLITRTAGQFLGTPYRFGGESADGIDCSSFVQQVFREHKIALPRTAREQSRMGSDVAPGDLKKGDLIFFHTYASYPSHVGIYLGDGRMIHASSAKGEVTISDINSDYYRSRLLGVRRVA